MSKVKIQGNASGTGVLTIEAPNTNTDRTITLPDVAGEILTDGQALPAIDGSALTGITTGKVLQVVHDTDASEASSSTSTFADTGLEATITPSSASNKILINVQHTGCAKYGGSSNNTALHIVLLRDGSQIALVEKRAGYNNNTSFQWIGGTGVTLLETANTTSAITFKTQFARWSGDGDVRINDDNSVSSITLMEISV